MAVRVRDEGKNRATVRERERERERERAREGGRERERLCRATKEQKETATIVGERERRNVAGNIGEGASWRTKLSGLHDGVDALEARRALRRELQ